MVSMSTQEVKHILKVVATTEYICYIFGIFFGVGCLKQLQFYGSVENYKNLTLVWQYV